MTATSVAARLDAIPLLALLRAYQRRWLSRDVLAALTVWALLVPQGLAYAQLAGLDPVVGLYASLGAIVGYALLGGVREMSVGPEATIALLSVAIVGPLSAGDGARFVALSAGLALIAGIILVLGGVARLGFIRRYLSRPLLTGYVIGSAIVMIVSQLDSLLGISLGAQDDTLAELRETIRRLPEADFTTLAVGLGTMAVVVLVRRLDRRLPAYDAPLFFANSATFADEILVLIDEADPPMRRLVVSSEAITSLDSTAESMLRDLIARLRARGVTLELARPKKPLRDFLAKTGLLDEIGLDHVYPRVSDAVDAFLAAECRTSQST